MLDPQLIRDNPDKVRQNTAERQMDAGAVDQWQQADNERKRLLTELEGVRREQNEVAEAGKQGGNVEELRTKGRELKQREKDLLPKFDEVDKKWTALLHQIPNIHFENIPKGGGEKDNVEVRKWGEPPKFDFQPLDHVELGKRLDLIDFEAGAKVAGSQFYFTKNDMVKLELALMQFGTDFLAQKGYTLVATPDLAKSRFYLGTGYSPRGDEAQIYEIAEEDLGLIATAEVTMAGMFADETLDEATLPLKFAAISHCFRREAGAYGKYSKGLYRVHQFTKLEMFIYCLPQQSEELHQEMLKNEEEITQALGIPYRVVEMCTGDLGAMAARKYDLEAWMPGRNDYGEITSTSNTTDFQARNLNVRFRRKSGEKGFAHMLNGTAIVSSRIPIALLENFQQSDGSIKLPEPLQKYLGKDKIIPRSLN